MHQIVIKANNIISPLGFSTEENYRNLASGKTGLSFQEVGYLKTSLPLAALSGEKLEEAGRQIGLRGSFTKLERMCILSVSDVLAQSAVDVSAEDTLVMISSTKGNIDLLEKTYKGVGEERIYLPELGKVIQRYFNLFHSPVMISNACISGTQALVMAARMLRYGYYKNIIVCGADVLSKFVISGFRSLNALSDEMCRPFDRQRKGINLGEAAASVLLSRQDDAVEKRVKILEAACSNDANHISAPSRTAEGLFRIIQKITKDKTIDFISAHGTATIYNDEMEATAFDRSALLGCPLHSLKGYFGHTLGASGVIESVIAAECLQKNFLIASKGFEELGVSKAVKPVLHSGAEELNTCLKTSSGFGGGNAAIVFSNN